MYAQTYVLVNDNSHWIYLDDSNDTLVRKKGVPDYHAVKIIPKTYLIEPIIWAVFWRVVSSNILGCNNGAIRLKNNRNGNGFNHDTLYDMPNKCSLAKIREGKLIPLFFIFAGTFSSQWQVRSFLV